MLDCPSCLIPVSQCDTLPESEEAFVVQWLLPHFRLHNVKANNLVGLRKIGRRRTKTRIDRIRNSRIESKMDMGARPESGGNTHASTSGQTDKVREGKENATEECEEGACHGSTDACTGFLGHSDAADVRSAPAKCSSSHGEMTDEILHVAEVVDTSYLPGLDDAVALRCLAFLPCTHHQKIAALSRRHRDLIRSSLLLELRQEYRILEHWICIYTNGWAAFDPKQNIWRNLPSPEVSQHFESSDRESLAAGTHLMWLGREMFDFACFKYDKVSDSWERGPVMINPRCLFASATCGKYAFVAGGFSVGVLPINVLRSAERYDSSRGVWEPLPPMPTSRQRCSGFFMDGKFYVIGGKTSHHEPLTSGEEFDLERNVWRTIENMYCASDESRTSNASPPLVAVAGNELYTIERSTNLLKAYEKRTNTWKTLGQVPVNAGFLHGWGLAFKGVGDELFVIGRFEAGEQRGVVVFSWRVTPGASHPEWQQVNLRTTGVGNFLYNCAVMAC